MTNLRDHGPGSLREAVQTQGPRVIIFAVSGIINLESKLIINEPWVTIAGQAAPDDGICIRGEGIKVQTHDVIIRHLRVRPGDIDFGPPNVWNHVDAISIGGDTTTHSIVIDHCSLSWSVDEVVGLWDKVHDITIQYCIISEALNRSKHPTGAHGMGMLIGSKATNISVHHNFFAHNSDRNPLVNGVSKVDIRNNVIYNPARAAVDLTGRSGQMVNLVNNYIVRGPLTNIKADVQLRDTADKAPKLFIDGNIGTGRQADASDNWRLVRDITQRVPDRSAQLDQPFPPSPRHYRVGPGGLRTGATGGRSYPPPTRRGGTESCYAISVRTKGLRSIEREAPLGGPLSGKAFPRLMPTTTVCLTTGNNPTVYPVHNPMITKTETMTAIRTSKSTLNGTDPLSDLNNFGISPQSRDRQLC